MKNIKAFDNFQHEEINEALSGKYSEYLEDLEELILDFSSDFNPKDFIDNAKNLEKELIKVVKSSIKRLVQDFNDEL